MKVVNLTSLHLLREAVASAGRKLKSTGKTRLSNLLLWWVWNPVGSGLVNPDWEFCIMLTEEAFPISLLLSYIVVTVLQSYPLELFSIQLGNSLRI